MQNVNYARMSIAKLMVIVAEGLRHMRISMLVAKWQCKWFTYEQPKGAKSWLEPEVKEVQQLPDVQVECHMCCFGMRVNVGLNKKPALIMTL